MPKGSDEVMVLKATTGREDADDLWSRDAFEFWSAIQDWMDAGLHVTVWREKMLFSDFCEAVKDYPDGYEE